MPPRAKNEPEKPTSPEQAKKYDKLIGKSFIKIDPTSKKPYEEAKEFFWVITHTFRSTLLHASGFRTMFQIQRVHRNKFADVEKRLPNGGTQKVRVNVPWKETTVNEEGQEELYQPGDMLIDSEEFTKRFAIDETAPVEEEIMSTVNSLEEQPAA